MNMAQATAAQPQPTIFDSVPPTMEVTPDDAAKVAAWLRDQPPFLVENMKAVVAGAKKLAMQCLRVTKSSGATVANVASELVLMRTTISDDIAAGAYILSKEPTKAPPRSHWSGYPDVDLVQPDFAEMAKYQPAIMDRNVCGQFLTFCQAVRSVRGQVVIEKDSAFMIQDPTKRFNYPFNIQDRCIANPDSLIHAFKEAQRYDFVYIGRQKSDERCMPLVIGRNWNNCVLISTQSGHTYYQESMGAW